MWEIKFQERSSKNHVIHKVNFMVITKVERLMLPNILQSVQELHYLESLWNCLSINTSFMNMGSLVPDIILWGFKGWQSRPFLQKLSKFGGSYLPHHWSDLLKILDLVLWVPKQRYMYIPSFNKIWDGRVFTHWVIWHRMTQDYYVHHFRSLVLWNKYMGNIYIPS